MRESTFRLLIDANDESYRKHILSTTFFIEGVIFALVLVIALFLPFFFTIRYFQLIILSIYAYCLYEIYSQSVRAVYSSTVFVIISFLNAFFTVASVLLLHFVFKREIVEALFVGNIIARFSSILIIELPRRVVVRNLSLRFVHKKYVKEIFDYSIPMMWTAIAFGLITSPGKYFVNHFLGTDANGVLAPAQKYMSILFMLGFSFHQAWQVTAVKNYKEHGSDKFFSEVFNRYAIILCLLAVCISFGLRSFKSILIGPDFYRSIEIIYVYCISGVCYCLALFFEITYQCTKQTSKILYSIVSCAVISVPLTFVLTKYFGLTGMISALTISYAYLFVYRYFQTKSTLPIQLNKNFILSLTLLAVGGIIFHCINNPTVDYIVLFSSILALLVYFLKIRVVLQNS